jgi:hypothetical protein
MTEVHDFRNDKSFIHAVERIQRKTEPTNKRKLLFKALDSIYFKNNQDAAEALKEVLTQDTPKKAPIKSFLSSQYAPMEVQPVASDIQTDTTTRKIDKWPVERMGGESVKDFGHRLFQNGEYYEAMQLYLAPRNIQKYWYLARNVAKFYLKDEQYYVAESIFTYFQEDPEKALILAECSKVLWKEQEHIIRNNILKWTSKITNLNHINDVRIQLNNFQWPDNKKVRFAWIKKLLWTLPQDHNIKKLNSIDTPQAFRLMSGMETLW